MRNFFFYKRIDPRSNTKAIN